MPQTDWLFFRTALLDWYEPERRPMPWKGEPDPYRVWLSEIILQQTRVAQGLPYFERFVAAYPTVTDLAGADDDAVLKLWEGLGYYSRARNLLRAARTVANDLDGHFPDTYTGLKALPGVGPYTAAAIASFAFGRQVAVLDGNVYRVIARFAGDEAPTDGSSGRKHFQQAVDQAMGDTHAADFNQAIMDFGALVCTPRNAACPSCPLAKQCKARAKGTVYDLPVKKKSITKRSRYFHYLVIKDTKGSFLLQQRTTKDIWQSLYEFPLIEADTTDLRLRQLMESEAWPTWLEPNRITEGKRSLVYRQQLSHQTILAVFHQIEWRAPTKLPDRFVRIDRAAHSAYALPRVINRYLEDGTLTLDL
ncbi:A/G-specific DNA-adenine glycosylase [Neolewinella xylanilytica]|uniref:Adenine DNA glycosylase n=1 Tax=Neolewinella xylanilytica TaxID=1514080 RepID=A0A2S6I0W7_9BACT|nr:A/G-specific adenine glycosylase [Neolewinella xylanilytica]PPK84614.1 A/G-specific DNA-adenine glycosylase [Neolewinella xylanilytica]